MRGFPTMSDARFTDVGRLVVRCPDRPGIVAVLSRLMADAGANIIDSQQHSSDPTGGTFTLRRPAGRRPGPGRWNHRDLEPGAHGAGIPFHHVPVTPETKDAAEARALEL